MNKFRALKSKSFFADRIGISNWTSFENLISRSENKMLIALIAEREVNVLSWIKLMSQCIFC